MPGSSTAIGASTVPAVIHAHAESEDGSEFLRLLIPGSPDLALCYRELIEEGGRWSKLYTDAGINPGNRAIVVLPHSVDVYAAYIGALMVGVVPAMFAFPSPKLSEEQYFSNVGELIRGARARMVITYPELAGKLATSEQDALAGALVVTPADAAENPRHLPPPSAVSESSTAFLQYSSGTTGLKKGVALSHRAVLWQVHTYGNVIGAGPGDRIATWLPLYHDMGLIACFFLPLLLRVPVVAMSPFDWTKRPGLWLQAVSEHRATLGWLPNFAYSFMAANAPEQDLAGVDLASLRGVVNCSEPVMAASHEAFLERFSRYGMTRDRLAASYAMAENTFAVTSGGFDRPLVEEWIDSDIFERDRHALAVAPGRRGARRLVSSGRALPETEIIVVGQDGRPLEDRYVGEIAIRSPSLLNEYDNNPAATARALRDGLYFTGDLGYLVSGELFVTGRAEDLIIVGGRNIYPQDIEAVVGRVPEVVPGRVAAVGVRDEQRGTEDVVVLAETQAEPATHDEIRRSIYTAVAGHTEVVPRDVILLPHRSLLKSSSGKIARNANRDRFVTALATRPSRERDHSITGSREMADSDIPQAVRRCVADVVGQAVEDDTPLLSSGLIDSLSLAELLIALEGRFNIKLTPEVLSDTEALDSIRAISDTIRTLPDHVGITSQWSASDLQAEDIPMTFPGEMPARTTRGWRSWLLRFRLRRLGVRCGPGLRALGPVLLQLEGDPRNIQIGRNVTLMPGVHLKNRENGRITLHDGVKLDTMTRLVAANDARIELGERAALGLGTVINAGRDVLIGRGSFTAAYCVINASDHGMAAGRPMQDQPYDHAPILIADDVWLGAGVLVSRGARIASGGVVSAGALVTGDLPPGAVVHGQPARVIKFRR